MSFALIVVLALLCFPLYAIGSGDNSIATICAILFVLAMLALYAAPAVVAHTRAHRNRLAITVLTVLLGWTFFGWVIALVWAYTANRESNPNA